MTQTQPTSPDLPWTAYVDALLVWRRFIVWAAVGSWVLVLVLGLVLPRTYDCEATLSFPPTPPQRREDPLKPGIPIPIYKRFNKALTDEKVLAQGLKGVLEPAEVRPVLQALENHVAPVTTSPLGDAQRMSREDTVIGVKISYSGQPAERAVRVVNALAKLCRDTLIRTLAQEQIEQRMVQANEEARLALRERVKLGVEKESLQKLDAELSGLLKQFPGSDLNAGRQVVETREDGHLYLPPVVQLVGVRAKIADNGHEIRIAEHNGRLNALRLGFLGSLNEHLDWEKITGAEATETLTVIREDLKRFLAQGSGEDSDLTTLKLEAENMVSALASAAQTTTLVQLPTVRRQARVPLMLGAAALSTALVLLVALLGESWRRLHASS